MSKTFYSGTAIEHPAAYEAAIKRNIINNARKTWRANTPDHQMIEEWLSKFGCGGEYTDDFGGSLARAFDTYGKLTPKQADAIRNSIIKREAKKAEWKEKNDMLNATREFLGEVAKRIEITVTCTFELQVDGIYGSSYICIGEDANHNVVVYKGNGRGFPMKGETKTIICTVKKHDIRDGVKQTIINRPKIK